MIRNGEWGFNLVFSEKMKGEDQGYKGDVLRKKKEDRTLRRFWREKKKRKKREKREERKEKERKKPKTKNLTFS